MVANLNQMGRPKKSEPTEPIRIPKSVVRRIRRIAMHLEMDPGDYIATRFGALLDRDEEKMLKEIEKEREEGRE